MVKTKLDNKISLIIEQKFSEYFGDIDVGDKLNSSFLKILKKRIQNKNKKLVSHSEIVRLYG